MPVTAKFSEEFYRAFGHKQVDELVNWCNQLDTTYRSEFRDLFEVNFARFDAKLEQRIAELRAELKAELRQEMGSLRQEMQEQMGTLRLEFMGEIARLRTDFAQLESRLTLRMFLFWIATVGIFLLQKM